MKYYVIRRKLDGFYFMCNQYWVKDLNRDCAMISHYSSAKEAIENFKEDYGTNMGEKVPKDNFEVIPIEIKTGKPIPVK